MSRLKLGHYPLSSFSNQVPKLPYMRLSPSLAPNWEHYGPQTAVVTLILVPDPEGAEAQIVLTLRSRQLPSHQNQISFPGGYREDSDLSPVDTARRECVEELGLKDPSLLKYHGTFAELNSLRGDPVIALLATARLSKADLRPSAAEVERVILAPWTRFQKRLSVPFLIERDGFRGQSEKFILGSDIVWGLTAAFLFKADLRPH